MDAQARWAAVAIGLVASTTAFAGESLTWSISVGGKVVGERKVEVVQAGRPGREVRVIDLRTTIDGSLAGQPLQYKQRVDGVAGRTPASFHAVLDEGGEPRELQAQYSAAGWTITTIDRRDTRTYEADASRIVMSTVDLFDPGSRYAIGRFEKVNLLSAETGDVWEGEVEALGHKTVRIGEEQVGVDGWAWKSPEGRHEFWYDAQGVMVSYETRILGFKVEGVLTTPPPPGPDDFPVRASRERVEIVDLG